MSLTLNSQTQQILAVGVPVAALALTLAVVYPSFQRYRALAARVERQRTRERALRTAPVPQPGAPLAAVEASEDEPTTFMSAISAIVTRSQCELANLEVDPESDPPSSVRPTSARLTVRGHYPQLRALVAAINSAPRLYAIRQLSVRSNPGEDPAGRLTATLTVERYVMPRMSTASAAQP